MQEVTAAKTAQTNVFDQLRSSALVDTSSQSRAFSDFLGLMSGNSSGAQSIDTQINSAQDSLFGQQVQSSPSSQSSQSQASTQTATQQASATGVQSQAMASDVSQSAAKNTPVSREAFEEAKPILYKAGCTDAEMADMAARVQAGTLTWGQMVQTMGTHMAGSKKSVQLSDSETASLQVMLQKLGFASDAAGQMAKGAAGGNGLAMLSSIQNKLSTMADDATPGISKDELSTLLKSLKAPAAMSKIMLQNLDENSSVADWKSALSDLGNALKQQQQQSAQSDTDLAKSLGRIMQKDVAKAARDNSQSTSAKSGSDSGQPQAQFELKTKDKNDTSWFTQHEKNQQKASDDSWNRFVAKVRGDESVSQQTTATQSAVSQTKDSALDALSAARTAQAGVQAKTDASQQSAKAYEKVNAPKVLDQVTEAMLKDLGQGRKQMTVQLDPENMGKLQVVLQVKGKEVNAVIRAEDADTAAMLSSNMDGLKKSLEDQGLTVQNIEVQTGLAGNQQQASFSAEEHNQAQQQQDMSRVISQLRMLRGDMASLAPDMQNTSAQAILAEQGLHIIA